MNQPTSLRLETVSKRSGFAALRESWDELNLASAKPGPFLDWEYLDLWWQHHEKDETTEVHILIARIESTQKIIGFAPLMIGRNADISTRFRYLGFLGTYGNILSEYEDFLIADGWRQQVVDLFADAIHSPSLRKRWDVLALSFVPENSKNVEAFAAALKQSQRINLQQIIERKSYTITFDGDYENWVASRSKKFRKHLRAIDRKIQNEEDFRVEIGSDICSGEEFLDHFQRLCAMRWGSEGEISQSDAFRNFHTDLINRWQKSDQVLLTLLYSGSEVIGVEYGFVFAEKYWAYQGTWNPEYKHLSPAWISQSEVVRHNIDSGLKEFDFLPGEEDFKRKWSTGHWTAHFFEAANPATLKGRAFQLVRALMKLRRSFVTSE